tara:strand:+ start:1317 stop:1793 length:477 start_codon:yes stop_codon:yes gene_type:complete
MNQINIYIIGLIILGIQILLSDFLSLNGIRPDFILIFLLYVSVRHGSFIGILLGFTLGLFADLLGVSTSFGLSPLTYTLTGYILGLLCYHNKIHSQLQFHSVWLCIIFLHFFCTTFIRYQYTVIENPIQFILLWILTSLYTLGFTSILQIIKPLYIKP